MLAGNFGIALFPADKSASELDITHRHVKIDHFAFRVDAENFRLAQERFHSLDIPFSFRDHHYYHSIYTKDPDGHVVELTTQVLALNLSSI